MPDSTVSMGFWNMDKITISNSRSKYVLLLLVSVGFVGAGIFLASLGKATEEKAAGWTSILFFGACGAVFIRQLFDFRPRLIIDEHGINDRTLGVGLIPWPEITDAYVKSIRGGDFICLKVRNPEMWLGNLSPVKRAMIKANLALGFTELNINLSGTNANTWQMLELIQKRSAASQKSHI